MPATQQKQGARQPKTRKGKRALEKRAPKEVEDPKRLLVLQGNKTSQIVKDVMSDFRRIKGDQVMKYSHKNDCHPFEPGEEASLQFYCERSHCGMFLLGNHSKKRPHNIVLGRTFDAQLLDMVELGIVEHSQLEKFTGARSLVPGSRCGFLFMGREFSSDPSYKQLRSLLVDVFQGSNASDMNMNSLQRMFVCSVLSQGNIALRQYAIQRKLTGNQAPTVQLEETGPYLELKLRRVQHAPDDLMREALKRPPKAKKKEKNAKFDEVDGKVGRIYMPKQDFTDLSLVKAKGVKRKGREIAAARKHKKTATDDS